MFCVMAAIPYVRHRFGVLSWMAAAVTVSLGFVRFNAVRALFADNVAAAVLYALFYMIAAGVPIIAVALSLRHQTVPLRFAVSLRAAAVTALCVLPFSLLLAYGMLLVVSHLTCAGNNCL